MVTVRVIPVGLLQMPPVILPSASEVVMAAAAEARPATAQ